MYPLVSGKQKDKSVPVHIDDSEANDRKSHDDKLLSILEGIHTIEDHGASDAARRLGASPRKACTTGCTLC
jgi:hypothetical protein